MRLAAEAGGVQALEELVPVGQVERLAPGRLRAPRTAASRRSALTLAGLEVLAAQDVVDVLQPGPAEREGDADPQHLVGARVDEGVLRGLGPVTDGSTAARLNSSSSRRPFSQCTDISVRMKSAWLSLTPSELIRTKISATCSSSARQSSSTTWNRKSRRSRTRSMRSSSRSSSASVELAVTVSSKRA